MLYKSGMAVLGCTAYKGVASGNVYAMLYKNLGHTKKFYCCFYVYVFYGMLPYAKKYKLFCEAC